MAAAEMPVSWLAVSSTSVIIAAVVLPARHSIFPLPYVQPQPVERLSSHVHEIRIPRGLGWMVELGELESAYLQVWTDKALCKFLSGLRSRP